MNDLVGSMNVGPRREVGPVANLAQTRRRAHLIEGHASPETSAAYALTGVIADLRSLDWPHERISETISSRPDSTRLSAPTFAAPSDFDRLEVGDAVEIRDLRAALEARPTITASVNRGRSTTHLRHDRSRRSIDLLLSGGVIKWLRDRTESEGAAASLQYPERAFA